MDRLPVVALCALALAGCPDDTTSAPPPVSRVNAVTARAPRTDAIAALCDVHNAAGQGALFTPPPLAEGSLAATVHGWRWVNVWATWCHPCIEEMPRLVAWRAQQQAHGTPVALELVSADDDASAVASFRAAHAEVPVGARLPSPDALATWLRSLGLTASGSLPVHVLVGPDNHVRCVRAGSVGEEDMATVQRLVAGG